MEEILLRPRDGSPHKCLECGEMVPQGSIHSHMKSRHDLTVAQYRDKFNIARHSNHGRGRFWAGKIALNRKYDNLKTEVECCICYAKFMMDTKQYHSRIKRGKVRFACPDGEGVPSKCKKTLQAITIKEVRNTPESRAKTSRQMLERWQDKIWQESFSKRMKNKPVEWHQKRISAMMKSKGCFPNKPEKKLIGLFSEKGIPLRYVGDGSIWIGKLNPDFINEEKRIIVEHFGCYYHGCAVCGLRSKAMGIPLNQRLTTYAKHGYRTIVIWEHELSSPGWQDKILAKLSSFLSS